MINMIGKILLNAGWFNMKILVANVIVTASLINALILLISIIGLVKEHSNKTTKTKTQTQTNSNN